MGPHKIRATGPNKDVAHGVFVRDLHGCARCGRSLVYQRRGFDWSIHHRIGRGMGGTKDPAINSPANLLTLCGNGTTGCHGWVTANPKDAAELGYVVSRFDQRPTCSIPVKHAAWGEIRLLDDGTWEPED